MVSNMSSIRRSSSGSGPGTSSARRRRMSEPRSSIFSSDMASVLRGPARPHAGAVALDDAAALHHHGRGAGLDLHRVVLDPRDLADQPAGGHHLVALLQPGDELLVGL